MKKLIFVLSLVSILICAGISYAGSTEIINGLQDMVISEIYLSRASTDDWEEDLLGDDTLAPGESVVVEFAAGEDECEWDLRGVDEDENVAVWENLNLCGVGSITLKDGAVAVLE